MFRKLTGESRSGIGSTATATIYIKKVLHKVMDHLKLVLEKEEITFLDSSCGDMNWMPGWWSCHAQFICVLTHQ